MTYRDELLASYVTSHTSQLYGPASTQDVRKQFDTWTFYFRRFLPQDKDARILDAGCGNGGFVYFLQERGYGQASGVDISQEQIDVAVRLNISNVSRANIFDHLKDRDDSFDLIIARDLLEHLPKDHVIPLLRAFHRSLRPGAKLVMQVPNGESPLSGRIRYGDFTHELSFTRTSIEQILLLSGFSSIMCFPVEPTPKGLKSIARFAAWKIVSLLLRGYVLVETGSSAGIFTQNIFVQATKQTAK